MKRIILPNDSALLDWRNKNEKVDTCFFNNLPAVWNNGLFCFAAVRRNRRRQILNHHRRTIIPFCTTMGAGVAESIENITSLADGATVLDGVTLRTGCEDHSEDISEWLSDIGMK